MESFTQIYALFELEIGFINMQLTTLGKPKIYLESNGGKYTIYNTKENKPITKAMIEGKMHLYLEGFTDALDLIAHKDQK
jgi:hypothetical protein